MRSNANWLLLGMLAVLVAAGCALPGSEGTTTTTLPGTTTSTESNLGGDRLPVQVPGEVYGHFPTLIGGDLFLEDNGCWTITLGEERRVVVFPAGFTKSPDGAGMTSAEGVTVTSGDAVDGRGGLAPVASLPGVPDGYWGNYLAFCDATAVEVVVFDDLSPASDPTAMTNSELVAMLREARLTESWGCGLGFTLSTPAQDVALYIYPADMDAAPNPPVTFPDAGWTATVVLGKHLLVNHCDDVVEYWEPEPVVAAEWPVTAGALDFDPPEQTGFDACGAAGPVTAILTGVAVETDEGPVELGDLTIVNEAYGCFAG